MLHGTYSATGMCSHTNSPGGCLRVFAGTGSRTDWYYTPVTTDDVTVQCKNDANATYVAP